ncbi:MAG: hypothetical protein OZ922_01305 [Myxococcales bacterium]|jgi:hypothetical protein|nr:hypothetical protein [Myxococcales bacterium]
MQSPIRALVCVLAIALTSTALAAPAAKQYQSSLTTPPNGAATIKITKPSKVIIKVATGSISFQLKVGGITDTMDQPVNLAGNTFQVDFIRPGGNFVTQQFTFDISDGKANAKFPLALSAFPLGAANPGETIDLRAVRLVQSGTGFTFGVAGLTLK